MCLSWSFQRSASWPTARVVKPGRSTRIRLVCWRALVISPEVRADQHAAAHRQPCREGFILAVAQAQNVGVVGTVLAVGHLEHAEVTVTVVGGAVGFGHDAHVLRGQRLLDLLNEADVGDWMPAFGGLRRLYFG